MVLNFLFIRSEGDIWLLYVLTVVQLSISAFFEPTRAAVMPSLVARQDLVTANALDGVTWSTMLALGAALGGLAATVLGISAAFIIDAATFVMSAWFVSRIVLPVTLPEPESAEADRAGWGAFRAGVSYLWQRPSVLALALVKASSALAFGGIAVVEVTFAREIFPLWHNDSATLGLIYLTIGVGTGLGPLVARKITGDNHVSMQWGIWVTYIAMLVGYFMEGWAFSLIILLAATLIRTIGTGINWVYSSSLLQMIVPGNYLGRVFAFDLAMMTLASSVSTLWVGWAKDNLGLGPRELAMSLGLVPLLMTLLWLIYMTWQLKRQQASSCTTGMS